MSSRTLFFISSFEVEEEKYAVLIICVIKAIKQFFSVRLKKKIRKNSEKMRSIEQYIVEGRGGRLAWGWVIAHHGPLDHHTTSVHTSDKMDRLISWAITGNRVNH